MKRLLLLLLLAAAGYGVYRYAFVEPPWRAFRSFARAWAREDTPAALAWTSGDAARKAVEERILRGVVRFPMEALRGSRLELEARQSEADGVVAVTAKQFVYYDPPGVTSGVGGAAVATVRHFARMKKTDDGWRVIAWSPTLIGAGPRRR